MKCAATGRDTLRLKIVFLEDRGLPCAPVAYVMSSSLKQNFELNARCEHIRRQIGFWFSSGSAKVGTFIYGEPLAFPA